MSDKVGEWVSAHEALQLVSHVYSGALSPHISAVITLRERLAEGSLRAKCTTYSFGCRFPDGTEKQFPLEDGCIPMRAWHIFDKIFDHLREGDWNVGDFSFDAKFDQEHYLFKARDVTLNLEGLPALAIARRQALVRQATPPIDGGLSRGPRAKWAWERALSYLVASAHTDPDGLLRTDGEEPSQSDIANIMGQWFIDTYKESPSDAELRKRGKLVLDEIKAIKARGSFPTARLRQQL